MPNCINTGCVRNGWATQGGRCTQCFIDKRDDLHDQAESVPRETAQQVEQSDRHLQRGNLYPDGAPDMWFVEAVPYTVELMRYFKDRSSYDVVQKVLDRLIADLEMGEAGALDLVRDLCLTTAQRVERETH